MLQLLRYYWLALSHPKARDFLDMGFGIVARARRSAKFWAKHLELCREVQSKLKGGRSLGVLGAGRLLDLDPGLCERFGQVSLYDADPSVLSEWKQFAKRSRAKVDFHLVDLSGALERWTGELESLLKTHQPDLSLVTELLKGLRAHSPRLTDSSSNPYDSILSLNLLSQIPIYWRDRVLDLLARYWKCRPDAVGKFSDDLDAAIESSMAELQRSHLAQLSDSGAREIVLISDYEFYYYKFEQSGWQVEPALFGEAKEFMVDQYSIQSQSTWLWHIAPQGIEQREYGVIHAVRAVHYRLGS